MTRKEFEEKIISQIAETITYNFITASFNAANESTYPYSYDIGTIGQDRYYPEMRTVKRPYDEEIHITARQCAEDIYSRLENYFEDHIKESQLKDLLD